MLKSQQEARDNSRKLSFKALSLTQSPNKKQSCFHMPCCESFFCGTAGKQNTEIFAAYKKNVIKINGSSGNYIGKFLWLHTSYSFPSFVSQSKNGERNYLWRLIFQKFMITISSESQRAIASGSHFRLKNVIKTNFIWWESSIVLHIICYRKREHGEASSSPSWY